MSSISFLNLTMMLCLSFTIAAQDAEWIDMDFNGSLSQNLIDINGKLYLLTANGASNENLPGVEHKLTVYEILFNEENSGFIPIELITLNSEEDSLYSTLAIDYIFETQEWFIVQTFVLSQGQLRFRFLLTDRQFNIESQKHFDIHGFVNLPFHFYSFDGNTYLLGTILGPPQDWVIYMHYNHQHKGEISEIEIGQTSPMQSTWITSMIVDTIDYNMLVFYYNGIQEIDSNLTQIHTYLRPQIHTGTHGQVIIKGEDRYSHGAYRFGGDGYKLLLIQKYDSSFNIIKADTLGYKEHDNYPFVFNSIELKKNEILVGGHLDGPFSNPDIFKSVKKYYLAKYDANLNRIWYKEYGGDKAYWMTGLKILEDESCMAYGFITDSITDFRHAYLMHVSKTGEIISSSIIDPETASRIKISNDGSGQIIIINPEKLNTRFSVFSGDGIRIFDKQIIGEKEVFNLESLPSALYYYTFSQNNILISSGKLLKSY